MVAPVGSSLRAKRCVIFAFILAIIPKVDCKCSVERLLFISALSELRKIPVISKQVSLYEHVVAAVGNYER